MLFNSLEFLIFFPVVTALYFLCPHQLRWLLLLVASCVFYMFFIPVYILILLVTILIDYFAGIWIENSSGRKKKQYLWVSIISTCLVLFVFKYYNFFIGNFNGVAHAIGWNYSLDALKIILPIGLSFHTFQSLSYVVEVYRGNQKAEKHFGVYSLYVMFYPQLVAGPIERPQNILHQFYEKHKPNYEDFSLGIKYMIWGLFKKVVIADNLSAVVNAYYDSPQGQGFIPLAIASYLFAIQIYCDFSGYSDMAIGAARVMGFRLMENFNTPYVSTSIREFWGRWHISLSTWFRDYLYIPLGGNRVSEVKMNRNLLTVFAVSGFWHGANWTFVIWGALHGVYLVIENMLRKLSWFSALVSTKKKWLRIIVAFVIFQFVVLGWIFFRANSVADAWSIIRQIVTLSPPKVNMPGEIGRIGSYGLAFKYLLAFGFILIDPLLHKLTRGKLALPFERPMKFAIYGTLVALIVLLGFWGEVDFIYFQF
jgi:alginate O-acetyltransferase complex protein AlgI